MVAQRGVPVVVKGAPLVVRRARAIGRARGFTLVELLVVLAILGALLALSAAGYMAMSRGYDLAALEGRLEAVLRQARNFTLYEGSPATVFVTESFRLELREPTEYIEGELLSEKDGILLVRPAFGAKPVKVPRTRLVRTSRAEKINAVGYKTVGLWHFEESDESCGYLGRDCDIDGEIVLGKVGSSVLLNPPGGSAKGKIVARPSAMDEVDPFDLSGGGRIEMWVYAFASSQVGFLARRKGAFELKVNPDGSLAAAAGGQSLSTEGYLIPLSRWVKVAFRFTPEFAEITADDVVRAEEDLSRLTPPSPRSELVFGEGFSGVLDEIRVQARVEGESVVIPEEFKRLGDEAVFFDSNGRLDAEMHGGPVEMLLEREGKRIGVRVSPGGIIERITQ